MHLASLASIQLWKIALLIKFEVSALRYKLRDSIIFFSVQVGFEVICVKLNIKDINATCIDTYIFVCFVPLARHTH